MNRRIFRGIFAERRPATVAAKIKRHAFVFFDVQRFADTYGDTADRVDKAVLGRYGARGVASVGFTCILTRVGDELAAAA